MSELEKGWVFVGLQYAVTNAAGGSGLLNFIVGAFLMLFAIRAFWRAVVE